MRIIETKVYKFEELSDKAKEKARDWYREGVFNDSYDWECVYEDADRIAAMMGIDIDRKSVPLMSGKTRQEPCIWFSGFSSQGDGACFEGYYRFKKGAVRAVEDYAPQDKELSRIVRALYRVQRRHFYKLTAVCKHTGHYSHSGCMSVDVMKGENDDYPGDEAMQEVTDLMRDFADWIYERLEDEYEYRMSDESVDENIIGNEYEFTEEGERA